MHVQRVDVGPREELRQERFDLLSFHHVGDAHQAVSVRTDRQQAAAQLEVSESAVSLHIGQLRKELGDQLFSRTANGLTFTPGGLRLASRATELLGLQDITVLEVSAAGQGRRLLRVGASSLFAEHAAPGLIELFASRAAEWTLSIGSKKMRWRSAAVFARSAAAMPAMASARLLTRNKRVSR